MSEVSVITSRQKTSCCRGYMRYLTQMHFKTRQSNLFLKQHISLKSFVACCVQQLEGSVLVQMVCTGCSYRTAVTVSRIEQMSHWGLSSPTHMGYITIMKSNSKPVPFATIMTELFWAAEHEQSVFNIACSRITSLRAPLERSQAIDAELYFNVKIYKATT